jgi:acetylornithine deacetylase/succinyl-diaminopimelate desuccinylase-like protein
MTGETTMGITPTTTRAVAELCAELIRFDTSNYGGGRSSGEREIAEYIAALLTEAGYAPSILGPSPERANVVLRVPGTDAALPGLLVHGHLDVVPAEASDWNVPPFAGVIDDGYVWGRGAADMKDMVSMMLATLLDWADRGVRPNRDILFAFVADEEDRGEFGALWLVAEHPELFAGLAAAIGESGGHPTPVVGADGRQVRLYPIATAERGTMHIRLTARGPAGHGSRPTDENAVVAVLDAAHRIAHHRWPIHLSDTVRDYLRLANEALGHTTDLSSEAGILSAIEALGVAGEVARFTVRASATPTVLTAGYKVNVIPTLAAAELDVRCPPGYEDTMLATLEELIGDRVGYEFISLQRPVEAPVDTPWFAAMAAAIVRTDPDAVVVPFCMGGGTDAKAFTTLGIACYGFAPLGTDPDGRTVGGVHGVDERVPVAALETGKRVLDDFLLTV